MSNQPSRHFTLKPTNGGRLASALSLENIAAQDYSAKVNWQRELDAERLRKGYVKFWPNEGVAVTNQYDPGLTGDLERIAEVWRPNGQRALVAASETEIAWFDQVSGAWTILASSISPGWRRWEAVNISGDLILNNGVELPYVLRFNSAGTAIELSRLYEFREAGIASVGTICEFGGFLMLADVREIIAAQQATVMNGADPYGPVADSLVNRIQFRITWSEFGKPTQYALLLDATIDSAGARDEITLPFPLHSTTWPAGTNLAIIGAGAGGGTLEAEVVSIVGTTLTISALADSGLSYPLSVQVTRFDDVSSLVGFNDLEDDGSRILRMMPLQNNLVVYRDTGIFTGRYTGVVESPFIFRKAYSGKHIPFYRDTLINVRGEYHLYAGISRFWQFYGIDEPQQDKALILSQDQFYDGVTAEDDKEAFAVDNPNDREIWICNSERVLTYSYAYDVAGTIDVGYSAVAFIREPDIATPGNSPLENWLISSKGGLIYREGVGFQRDGENYVCELLSGFYAVNNEYTEKDIVAYVLLLGTGSPKHDIVITLFKAKNPGATKEQLFQRTVSEPNVENLIPTLYRGIYFQDRIRVTTGAVDLSGLNLTARMLELGRIGSNSATRVRTAGTLF